MLRTLTMVGLLSTMVLGACDCGNDVAPLLPQMIVDPEAVDLTGVPVAQDTAISIEIRNPSNVQLLVLDIALEEGGDPAFRFVDEPAFEVPANGSVTVDVIVRPLVISNISAALLIEAEPDALPQNMVRVPITVDAVDLGLPDIETDPEDYDFGRIGQGDVARKTVNISNVGIRDLLIDEMFIVPENEGDESFRINTPVGGGYPIQANTSVDVEVLFRPTDTEVHDAVLRIISNDPDETPYDLPLSGQGSECPLAVATLLDDGLVLEPLDTVRLDGSESEPVTVGTTLEEYEWTLEQVPQGSTAVLDSASQVRSQITCDIAGTYVARLQVTDSDGVRSCNNAAVTFECIPTEDLHLQLVWDHQSADVDLHLLREGGDFFNHEDDVYFSNREPEWSEEETENPTLDQDDSRGYGPENINLIHPAHNSRWTVGVHYWRSQTDGDPFLNATLRIFARGQLVADIPQEFEDDQTLWTAVEIIWPDNDDDLPVINPVGTLEPFSRPF